VKFRRRRLPEDLAEPFEAFRGVVARVERGKSALTEAVPTTRLPGRPLGDVLLEFEDELREALREMPSWRTARLEGVWLRCVDALEASLGLADRLRVAAPAHQGFEALIWTIGDLLDPLDALEEAADRFRDLRV
jgi:hypothetical protein